MAYNYLNLNISKLDLLFKYSPFIFKKTKFTKFNTCNIFPVKRVLESRIASVFLSRKSTTMNKKKREKYNQDSILLTPVSGYIVLQSRKSTKKEVKEKGDIVSFGKKRKKKEEKKTTMCSVSNTK